MAILGIDIGNYNLKTSSGLIIPATYTTKEGLLDNSDPLEVLGATYYIGNGTLETKLNKAEKRNILPLLYYGIIKSTLDPMVSVIVGLPVSQYKANKDKLRETILENKVVKVKYKVDRTIIIENCEVFPEGAGAYFSLDEKPKNCIVLDIGGRTTNIIHFENGKIKNANSKALGMINIYSDIRDYLNSNYALDLRIEQIETVIKEGLWLDGEKIEMNFIKPIIQDFITELMNELELHYPIRTYEVLLTGGGSFLLYGVLQKRIKRIRRLDNYLLANAVGYRKWGVFKWKEEEL